jgi:CheY-like chemotaxis protein
MGNDKRRVLLFEDDKTIRDLLRTYLEARGYEVRAYSEPLLCPVYHDGVDCRCGDEQRCGDIVLTDLEMPRMTGLELVQLQQDRGCRSDPRNVAVMSGAWNPGRLAQARELRCEVLYKPFGLADIDRWLHECERRIDPGRRLRSLDDD